jgi:PHS family inorganic phosphate transporter-like MFS transporter
MLDSIWRWIIGVGIILAFIALWLRLTIIESARYTADVGKDSLKAASEVNRYLLRDGKSGKSGAASVNSADRAAPISTALDFDNGDLSQRRSVAQRTPINRLSDHLPSSASRHLEGQA